MRLVGFVERLELGKINLPWPLNAVGGGFTGFGGEPVVTESVTFINQTVATVPLVTGKKAWQHLFG